MPSTNLGTVLSKVYSRIDNNVALYPREQVVEEINDCFKVINLLTGAVQTSVQVLTGVVNRDPSNPPLSDPQLVYQTPPGMIFPVAVTYEGRNLTPMSLRSMAGEYRSWATDISAPSGRPIKEWSPIGFKQFVIHPMDGKGGRSLIITGVAEPAPLFLDSDLIPLPNDDVDDLVDLVGSVLPVREGGNFFINSTAELYSRFIVKMKTKAAYTNLVWPQAYEKLAGWRPYTPKSARIPNAGE